MNSLFEFKSLVFNFLYQHLVKKIFFLIDAETIHNTLLSFGSFLGKSFILQSLTSLIFNYQNKNLAKTINDIYFPNPVGLSAGFDYNGDLTQILPSLGFGWHTIGTVTWEPYQGNPKPRLGRYPGSKALLVNKGLKSIGTRALIQKLKTRPPFKIPTGISIASTNKHFDSTKDQLVDIYKSFLAFEKSNLHHSYYEMNISCPNTFGGEPFTDPQRLEILLSGLDKLSLTKALYLKMPIDQSEQISLQLIKVASNHNVQGLIMGNLTKDKSNPDIKIQDKEDWQDKKGNLSGKPTWNRSNNLIKLTKKHYPHRFTIVGTGGIFSGEDTKTKLDLGADLTQLITGMIFQGPQLIGQINYYLSKKY